MGRSVGIIIIKIFFIQFFFQEKMVSMSTFYAPIISCDFPITSDPLSPRVYLLYKLIGSQRLRKAGTNPPSKIIRTKLSHPSSHHNIKGVRGRNNGKISMNNLNTYHGDYYDITNVDVRNKIKSG